MIESDKQRVDQGLPKEFNLSECDYSLLASSFIKHYFTDHSFITAGART